MTHQYYIAIPPCFAKVIPSGDDEAQFVPVKGRKVTIESCALHLFSHLDSGGWNISEATSGAQVCGGAITRAGAISLARDLIGKTPRSIIKKDIANHIERYGRSPWRAEA